MVIGDDDELLKRQNDEMARKVFGDEPDIQLRDELEPEIQTASTGYSFTDRYEYTTGYPRLTHPQGRNSCL